MNTAIVSQEGDPILYAIAIFIDAIRQQGGEFSRTPDIYLNCLMEFRDICHSAGIDLAPPKTLSAQHAAQYMTAITIAAQGYAGSSKRQKQVSKATYNQRLSALSSFYNYETTQRLLECGNPILSIKRPKGRAYSGSEALDPDSVMDVLATIDQTTLVGLRDYVLLSLFFTTGRRLREVQRLCIGDLTVTKTRGILHFRTKGGDEERSTVSPKVFPLLLQWLERAYGPSWNQCKTSPMWISLSTRHAGTRTQITAQSVERIFFQYFGTNAHKARHTFARTMMKSGATIDEIRRMLGHKNIATTGIYLAELSKEDNQYLDHLDTAFGI